MRFSIVSWDDYRTLIISFINSRQFAECWLQNKEREVEIKIECVFSMQLF